MTVRTTVGIDLQANASGLDRGVSQAGGKLSKLGGLAKTGGLAIAGGLALGGLAAIKVGSEFADLASDLAETESKSAVIFGRWSGQMDRWAANAWKSAGLSKQAALGSAAAFGDMFTQIGFSGQEAAKTSRQVVQLAADLGSFNNLETADVTDRISAAFRGEYDSLQAVIPNINAARVETQALAMTGKAAASELTAQEKVQATLAIITKDGARAQGDFARTSDGLANSQKILNARLENTKTQIGEKLLPAKIALTRFVLDKVIPAGEKLGAEYGEHVAPAMRRVADWIRERVIPASRNVYEWFVEKIAPGIRRTVRPVLDGLSDAWGTISGKLKDNEEELSDVGRALKKTAEFLADKVFPVLGDFYGKYLKKVGEAIGGVIDAIGWMIDKLERAIQLMNEAQYKWARLQGSGGVRGPSVGGGGDTSPGVGSVQKGALPSGSVVDQRNQSVTVNVSAGLVPDVPSFARELSTVLVREQQRLGLLGAVSWS